jgi:hypothetical protein
VSYILGLCLGFGCIWLKTKRRYSYLLAFLLVMASTLAISWASTYNRWPLSFPLWIDRLEPVNWIGINPPATINLYFFDKSLIELWYYSNTYSSVANTLFLHMYVINALAGLAGLATVLIPYTYWTYPRKMRLHNRLAENQTQTL